MLDDRQTEAGAPRGASAVTTVETLEKPREVVFGHARSVIGRDEHRPPLVTFHGQSEPGAGACVAQGVVDQILGNDVEHARAERKLDIRISPDLEREPGSVGTLFLLGQDPLELGQGLRRPEGDNRTTALQFREEEDIVDERRHLLDLAAHLFDDSGRIAPRLEKRHGARQGRPQLMGDDRGEARAQLLIRLTSLVFGRAVH